MKSELTGLEKWNLLTSGQDAGPMVSPLCDDWSLDVPYRWPFAQAEPFPSGHRYHSLSQQMAMAKVCGWDPTFLCGVDFTALREDIRPQKQTEKIEGGVRTHTRIATAYGDLTSIEEQKASQHVVKSILETEEDYRRMAWLVRQQMEYDEPTAIAQGQQCRAALATAGPMGTWISPPAMQLNRDMMFYHLADWPDAMADLRAAHKQFTLRQIETLRKAGFDYLFYCVDATEWISPDFFATFIRQDTRDIFRRWRELGGWILWHSCGRVAKFVEEGFYNDLRPEVFETVSEPPVGSLPSLAWGREKLDRRIVTKGNMPLNILLEGTPEDVRRDVRRIKDQTRGYRHVIGLSDDILKNTPLANAQAMVDEARRS